MIMDFRENLRFLMESKGIQTKELSLMTGISENTIKTYLRSASAEPKLSKAVILAQALGVSVEFLALGIDKTSDTTFSKDVFSIQNDVKNLSLKELKIVSAVIKAMND